MKFSTSSIIAMLASLAAFSLPSTHAADLVLWADADFAECTKDADLIGTELGKIYDGERRSLRSRELQSTFCKNHCKGFLPGTCYLVYPQCTGMRRNLANPPELPEDKTLACAMLQVASHKKLEELADKVDGPCATKLLGIQEFKCFRVVQN